jgi:hypothetical protein
MTRNPYSQAPQQPPYPQTPAYYPPQPRPSTWPVVIGYVSVGVASLFLLLTLWGVVSQSTGFGGARSKEWQDSLPDWAHTWQIVSGVFVVCAYGVLILAGLCLAKRRPIARPLHFLYAALAVPMTIIGTWLTFRLAEYVPMPAGPNVPPGMAGMMKNMMVLGAILGIPFALAYPTFLVIWFLRAPIAKEVRTWSAK